MVKLSFKQYRILFLLSILIYVITNQAIAKYHARSWTNTLNVVIYPINGDGTEKSQKTIDNLQKGRFSSIENFVQKESQRYGVTLDRAISIKLAPQVIKPPAIPDLNGGPLSAALWSLKMRVWAWYENSYKGDIDIRLFVEYYSQETKEAEISVGLAKGMMALVKNYTGEIFIERNNVIIAHEMLHTLGATDKYDPVTLMPVFPEGYVEPELGKGSKQNKCEIMAGRIPLSSEVSVVPKSLKNCIMSRGTSLEVGLVF